MGVLTDASWWSLDGRQGRADQQATTDVARAPLASAYVASRFSNCRYSPDDFASILSGKGFNDCTCRSPVRACYPGSSEVRFCSERPSGRQSKPALLSTPIYLVVHLIREDYPLNGPNRVDHGTLRDPRRRMFPRISCKSCTL